MLSESGVVIICWMKPGFIRHSVIPKLLYINKTQILNFAEVSIQGKKGKIVDKACCRNENVEFANEAPLPFQLLLNKNTFSGNVKINGQHVHALQERIKSTGLISTKAYSHFMNGDCADCRWFSS